MYVTKCTFITTCVKCVVIPVFKVVIILHKKLKYCVSTPKSLLYDLFTCTVFSSFTFRFSIFYYIESNHVALTSSGMINRNKGRFETAAGLSTLTGGK